MGQCSCEAESKVVPITKARVKLDGPPTEIDQKLLASLNRRIQEDAQRAGPREIDLFTDDIKALESQKFFKSRFGFVLGRRGREAVFEVMDRYDLTDDEVRALHRVGCFDWNGQTLRVSGKRWIGFAGSFYLMGIALMAAIVGLGLSSVPEEMWRQRLALWSTLIALLLGNH